MTIKHSRVRTCVRDSGRLYVPLCCYILCWYALLLESWKKHVDRQLDYLSHDSVVVSCKSIPWYAVVHEPYGTISQCNIHPFISDPKLTYAFRQPCKVSEDPRLINIHTTPPWLSSKHVSTTVQYTHLRPIQTTPRYSPAYGLSRCLELTTLFRLHVQATSALIW